MKHLTRAVLAALLGLTAIFALAPPASASTSQYVAFVRSEIPEARYMDRSEIIDLGKTICTSLNVLSVGTVAESGTDAGLTDGEVATLVVGAVFFICPKHKGKVQRWIDANT